MVEEFGRLLASAGVADVVHGQGRIQEEEPHLAVERLSDDGALRSDLHELPFERQLLIDGLVQGSSDKDADAVGKAGNEIELTGDRLGERGTCCHGNFLG